MAVSIVNIAGNQNVGASRFIINDNFNALKEELDNVLEVVDTSFVGGRTISQEIRVASNSVVLNTSGIVTGSNKTIEMGADSTIRITDTGTVQLPEGSLTIDSSNSSTNAGVYLEGISVLSTEDQIIEKGYELVPSGATLLETSKPICVLNGTSSYTVNLPVPSATLDGHKFKFVKIVDGAGTGDSVTITAVTPSDVVGSSYALFEAGESKTFICLNTDGAGTYKWTPID